MSVIYRLRTLLLCLPLLLGAFAGMPMRPEEIEDLLPSANQQKIVHVISEEEMNKKKVKV
jgi:hypothetical protein